MFALSEAQWRLEKTALPMNGDVRCSYYRRGYRRTDFGSGALHKALDQATQTDNEAPRDLPPRRQDIPGGAMGPTTIAPFSVSGRRIQRPHFYLTNNEKPRRANLTGLFSRA